MEFYSKLYWILNWIIIAFYYIYYSITGKFAWNRMYISNASSTVAPTTTQQLILPNDATTTMSSSTEDFGQHVTSTTPTTTTTTTTITANSNIDSKSIISSKNTSKHNTTTEREKGIYLLQRFIYWIKNIEICLYNVNDTLQMVIITNIYNSPAN